MTSQLLIYVKDSWEGHDCRIRQNLHSYRQRVGMSAWFLSFTPDVGRGVEGIVSGREVWNVRPRKTKNGPKRSVGVEGL